MRSTWSSVSVVALLMGAIPAAAQVSTQPYAFTFTPATATGTPRILKIELNSAQLQAGGPIAIRVSTTPDVVSVVTGRGKRSGALALVGPGIFTSEATLPHVKLLGSVRVKLHFVATTASGTLVSADVPVSYH